MERTEARASGLSDPPSSSRTVAGRGGRPWKRVVLNVLLSVLLGSAILWWMYRNFDFAVVRDTLLHRVHWGWILFSLVFGVTAQVFRGIRWRQTLDPLGEHPRTSTCVHAVFLSYASSLIVPRIGEVARCAVLRREDGTSFSKAVGTVVTERIVDSLLMLVVTGVTLLLQLRVFTHFFRETGVSATSLVHRFTPAGYVVTALLLVITLVFIVCLVRQGEARRAGKGDRLSSRWRSALTDVRAGILSLRNVENKWLFLVYTLAIWVSYFLHFHITFLAFPFTVHLSMAAALGAFVAGTVAVLVPTPNGMGPWHFAVKTLLVLYAVGEQDAETYVLIVHAVQTALVPLLGIYSLIALGMRRAWLSK